MEMTTIEKRLLDDHRRVVAAAALLKTLLNESPPTDDTALTKARWSFASTLMQYLALMERHVYAKLEKDARSKVRAFFSEAKSDLVQCFDAYSAHMANWPTARAIGSWSSYRLSSIAVVDQFLDSMNREASTILPFVRRMGIDIACPSGASSNWVRNAFAIKDSVENRSGRSAAAKPEKTERAG